MSKRVKTPQSTSEATDFSPGSQLTSPQQGSGSGRPRVRISHACDRCRALRTRCSGQPRCDRCVKDGTPCLYSDRKRERAKKGFTENSNRIQGLLEEKTMLIAALNEVSQSPDFNQSRHPDVARLLERIAAASEDETLEDGLQSHSRRQGSSGAGSSVALADETSSVGERRVLADVGSPSRQGEISRVVHLHKGSGLAGYIGKMSEISWIQRIQEHVEGKSLTFIFEMPSAQLDYRAEKTEDISYFVDQVDLLSVDEDYVNPHQYPPVSTAILLSEAFFHALHGSFYFVEREQFLDDLMTVQAAGSISNWSQRPFLAVCNMVWATAARWLEMTELGERTDAEDHLVYYARARSLGLDHRIQFDHADVQTVQGMGILAFYLLVNHSIQRSYSVLGQAIRHAIALGLHLKVTNGTLNPAENEKRRKIWNSLYRLEVLLSSMTGRPQCVSFLDVAVPRDVFEPNRGLATTRSSADRPSSWLDAHTMWLNFLGPDRMVANTFSGGIVEWSSFTSIGMGPSQSHFMASLQLCHLSDDVGRRLYSAGAEHTWFDVQNIIRELETRLHEWNNNLAEELKLGYQGWTDFDSRARLELATSFHSLRMMLYRPCLCDIKIDHESPQSHQFNMTCASHCVEGALHMINVLPDTLVDAQVLQVLPWWTLLHYICQAASVLLLELCLNMQHVPNESEAVMLGLRKALNCVLALSGNSKSASKAWSIIHPLFEKASQQYSGRGGS